MSKDVGSNTIKISLTPRHEKYIHVQLYSLIYNHEYVKSKLPPLVLLYPCYCYSMGAILCFILTMQPRMYARTPAYKRGRPSSGARPPPSSSSGTTTTSPSTSHISSGPPKASTEELVQRYNDRVYRMMYGSSRTSHNNSNLITIMPSSTNSRSRSRSTCQNRSTPTTRSQSTAGENVARGRCSNDSVCSMCSDSVNTRRHTHYSTTAIRRKSLGKSNQSQSFMCPMCKELEPVVVPASETRRIVLADSSLYGVWDSPKLKNMIHFDIDSIVGGRVRDMTTAFMKNYNHMPNRMEIVVVAGINNIGAGDSPEQIAREMDVLKQVVREHSQKWKHNPPSYVVFCTVLYAPKFCSLKVPVNPPEPEIAEWVPSPTFQNKFQDIKKLNDLILDKNKEGGQTLNPVRMDYQGIKRLKSGNFQHIFDNKPGAAAVWKEKAVFKKLHLTPENKMKMIGYIVSCFHGNSHNEPAAVHN